MIAQLFESAGVDELIVVELHAKDVMRFFTIPVTNVSVKDTIVAHIKKQFPVLDSVCLVAPDQGAHEYVKDIAQQLKVGTITCSKERFATDQTRVLDCVIDCEGVVCVIVDDMVSTGGTATNVTRLLSGRGYQDIFGYFVHPVLADDAVERMRIAGMNAIFVSNSLPLSSAAKAVSFITVFDISEDIVSILKEKLHEK